VFVRDGFSWGAFLFAPLWMLRHRLWLVLVCWVLVVSALEVIFRTFGVVGSARGLALAFLGLLIGLEAATLRRWTLLRAGWRDHGIVVADDAEAAEQRFFARWDEVDAPPATSDRETASSPSPASASPASAFAPGKPLGVIGLFPRAGGSS
jgi:hypothetical protein